MTTLAQLASAPPLRPKLRRITSPALDIASLPLRLTPQASPRAVPNALPHISFATMYRTNDPRFRRRLNEIGQTLEHANESAQSGLYIFGQNYVKPCFESVTNCLTSCVDASCPSLKINQRDRRLRTRQQRGRAELNFDFYDDWDEEENDGLLGWGNDEFDRLVAGGGSGAGYGTIAQQPGRKRGMNYPKGRRKSAVLPHDGGPDPTVIPGSSGFFSSLFGGKTLRYKPSAAGLQEHPGSGKRTIRARDLTEGEALLDDDGEEQGLWTRGHRRARSGTQNSRDTEDSFSSRGDIFPSDEEDDAIPLDDEFAMVLERRTTQSGSGPDPETPSPHSESKERRKSGKRPSIGSRKSTRRAVSTRSTQSGRGRKSRTGSTAAQSPYEETIQVTTADAISSLIELKQEERRIEQEEEADIARRRSEAHKIARERGLSNAAADETVILSSKEATPENSSPALAPVVSAGDAEVVLEELDVMKQDDVPARGDDHHRGDTDMKDDDL